MSKRGETPEMAHRYRDRDWVSDIFASDHIDDATELAIAEAAKHMASYENEKLVLAAVSRGRVDILKLMRTHFGPYAFPRIAIIRAAKAAGQERLIEYFSPHAAARSGNTDALQWMLENGCSVSPAMEACKDMATLQWFYDQGFKMSESEMNWLYCTTIRNGDIDMCRALHAAAAVTTTMKHVSVSVCWGNASMVELVYGELEKQNSEAHVKRMVEESDLCGIPIAWDDVPTLRFLLSKGFPLQESHVIEALSRGNEDVVPLVIARDPPCSSKVFQAAVQGGNLAAIEWAPARFATTKLTTPESGNDEVGLGRRAG